MATRTHAELVEFLISLSHTAQRQFPVVGTPQAPTRWDRYHRQIDDVLTLLEFMPAGLETMEPA